MPRGKDARQRYNRGRLDEDRRRGMRESRDAIATRQARWPAAFPKQWHLVRPLTNASLTQIAESTGWSKNYTRGVLCVWKSRDAYCQAVLQHTRRHGLDGAASEEEVDDRARQQAEERLAINRAARVRRQEKEAAASKEPPAQNLVAEAAE